MQRTNLELLRTWSIFIRGVRLGYPDEIYEYINDLDIRDTIERQVNTFNQSELKELENLDKDYVDNTILIDKSFSRYQDVWWYKHIPKRIPLHLVEDFKHYGVDYTDYPEAEILTLSRLDLEKNFPEYYPVEVDKDVEE